MNKLIIYLFTILILSSIVFAAECTVTNCVNNKQTLTCLEDGEVSKEYKLYCEVFPKICPNTFQSYELKAEYTPKVDQPNPVDYGLFYVNERLEYNSIDKEIDRILFNNNLVKIRVFDWGNGPNQLLIVDSETDKMYWVASQLGDKGCLYEPGELESEEIQPELVQQPETQEPQGAEQPEDTVLEEPEKKEELQQEQDQIEQTKKPGFFRRVINWFVGLFS